MTRTRYRVLLLSVCLLASWAPASPAQANAIVITAATLIDGTGAAPRPNTNIVIKDGIIVAVASADIPPDATVMDAAGKYVIPGLADMHVHFGYGGLIPANEHTTDRVLRQFLFYGVTSILNVGATGGSLEDIILLRKRAAEHALVGPHIYATGGLITIPGSHPIATIMELPEGADPATYDWSARGVWVVTTPAEIRAVVAKLARAHMDGVKIVVDSGPTIFGDDHPQMGPDLIAAAVEEGARFGLPVYAHASSIDELQDVVAQHVHAAMHLVRDPAPADADLLAAMKANGMYYVPTLSLFVRTGTWGEPADFLSDPFLRSGVEQRVLDSLLHSRMIPATAPTAEDWAWRESLLGWFKDAYDAGVAVAAGTDTANPFVFPGYSMHHELELMVEAGLTPMEALQAATRGAAEMLGQEDTFGTVTAGKRADLLILTANPLEDIRNTRTLETVIAAGVVIDRATIFLAE